MSAQRFKLSVFSYAVVIAFLGGAILLISLLILDLPDTLDWRRHWLFLFLIFSALSSPSFIVTWSLIVELNTSFSDGGISRLTLFGRKQIFWNQIEALRSRIFYLDIKVSGDIYRIPLLMYADPKRLVDYIHNQFASHSKIKV